jgi:hypothetical protein
MLGYSPSIEDQMRSFYQSLSEKDRRRYAAVEAAKLDRGGISYIAQVLECDRYTIRQGLEELGNPDALNQSRIRRPGGGRKPREEVNPNLDSAFLQVLQDHTAGSPMSSDIKWTNLTRRQIKEYLAQDHGIECECIRQWWWHDGQSIYRKATSLLLLCDGGGSNSSRTSLFKAELEKVSQEIGIEIRVAHSNIACFRT